MEKLRWPMDVFARKTNRSPRPAERSARGGHFNVTMLTCSRAACNETSEKQLGLS